MRFCVIPVCVFCCCTYYQVFCIMHQTCSYAENGEGLQVIHYGVGQKFVPHYDSRSNESFWNGGPRVATFLMYLSDVEEGGETVFPSAKPMKFSSNPYI
ncbi:putative procollagen-proline dioxygenase [Medicago truncatula]|uniref:Putative procollagen-proline dioxygenase n=1 Tax=Medicago truncatula TaxID=3880 RepID=A0A396IVT0_MEDTR|nr:putative procollagen-proline dioxygenase [Medicago truncatula]